MMKNIFGIILFIGLFLPNLQAQDKKDERAISTKIADLLAELPARDTKQFNRNMNDIAQLGVEGYINIINALNANDNEAILTYAISGYTAYVSQHKNKEAEKIAIQAYHKSLETLKSKTHLAFILSQFEIIGDDTVVPVIAKFLTDEQLADPAARALSKINTSLAQKSLIGALNTANKQAKLNIIAALGFSKVKAANALLLKIASSSNDQELTKITIQALANIAQPENEQILQQAAAKSNYKFDQTLSLPSYIIFGNEVLIKDKNIALKVANNLIANAKGENEANIRIAGFELLSKIEPSTTLFINGLNDPSFKFRAAALKEALSHFKSEETNLWVNKLKNVNPQTQVLILQFLAEANAKNALSTILKLTTSKDTLVKKAAIIAAAKIGQDEVLPAFLANMKNANLVDLALYAEEISKMKGDQITTPIANLIPNAKPLLQAALINILGQRAATTHADVVFAQLVNKNVAVQTAAFNTLKHVSKASHLPQLYNLLNESKNKDQGTSIQLAIIAALKTETINTQTIDDVVAKMKTASPIQQNLYFPVLASLGGKKTLNTIVEAFNSGDEVTKQAALSSLINWNNFDAAPELLSIAKNASNENNLDQVIKGYLKLLKSASFLPEQRLLKLRAIMEVAKTNNQKLQIIKDAEQAKTFNTLVFVNEYSNDPALKQSVAITTMNVALAGKYNGTIIKSFLTKAIEVITGADSDYQKEAMRKYIADMEPGEGFVAMFNGVDLAGWQGLVGNPISRSKMSAEDLAKAQAKANAEAAQSWKVINKELHFMIKGDNLATIKKYGDFEMLVDWKIIDDKKGEGDAGIYLRGTPQVQIWDNARTNVGAQVGSGGLYNNQANPSKPLVVADNKLDEWNTFKIKMVADRVTVHLNGVLVTDNVILENYWDRKLPIFNEEQIELQAHGSPVAYRDIYIKELPKTTPFQLSELEVKEGYKVLFDGTNMHNWTGNTTDYTIENGNLAIRPKPGKGSGGNLFTKEQYSDFIYRFEFKLTPGANNGLGIRAPLQGDAAYEGMELQILDNDAPIYKNLKEYQYHGSVYGVAPAKRGFLKPVGEWNYQEVTVKGNKIKVVLNGEIIVDTDITLAKKNGTIDGLNHPGLQRESGHIGFLGHGSPVEFRNIRIKDLSKPKK